MVANKDGYGKILYDDRGYPVCHICGKSFKKLMAHAWNKHGILAYDYKKEFGLEVSKGIMCRESVELARLRNKENYDKVVTDNLVKKGVGTRYESGHKGRTRDQVSAMTRAKLIEHIKSTPTHRKHNRDSE